MAVLQTSGRGMHVGGWTSKPAPLDFETAQREYLVDDSLDEQATDLVLLGLPP